MTNLRSWRFWLREIALLGCAVAFLFWSFWIAVAVPWIVIQTAPTVPSHALWRASLPGLDAGLDAIPARGDQDGALRLWLYPHTAEDIIEVLRVRGAPPPRMPPVVLDMA